jgi:hypothetical protein
MENRGDIRFDPEAMDALFGAERADRFFESLLGDASEGAYDIRLAFKTHGAESLEFEFQLRQRPGKCLACNLTYGLPAVFSRHPVIDAKGLVRDIDRMLEGRSKCLDWRLGPTREISRELHVIPLTIRLEGPQAVSMNATHPKERR